MTELARRLLLLSAYHTGSHRIWCGGLIKGLGEIDWTLLSLPPRHFRWRIRGNPLSWWPQLNAATPNDWDAVIATSAVDLATLKGCYPALRDRPALLYFHENQFAYPRSDAQHDSVDPQMVNLYGAMAADRLIFNSAFNRDSFFHGLEMLLAQLPEQVDQGIVEALRRRAAVIPVGLEADVFLPRPVELKKGYADRPLRIVWNHRVEYDKGVDQLYAIVSLLETQSVPFELILLGQRFKASPPEWQRLLERFQHRIVENGYLPSREAYLNRLRQCDVVLSTTHHEFQGLSVMEAVACGCRPVVPNRLSFPDYFGPEYRYETPEEAVACILKALMRPVPDLSGFAWSALLPRYRDEIAALWR